MNSLTRNIAWAIIAAVFASCLTVSDTGPAHAESVTDKAYPLPQAKPKQQALTNRPAKQLFGAQAFPAKLASRSFGSYAKGCLAGAAMLDTDGPAWQAMRLSRNRNWGHPKLIAYVERLAVDAKKLDGWPGLLVGDLSQPRGGPMLSGHSSHQIGLDADIWLRPAPNRQLTVKERETISSTSMIKSQSRINPKTWSTAHAKLIRRAASYPDVARIFVHPVIKRELCNWATGDRSWLRTVRPWRGHHYHFHVRLSCPPDSKGCKNQKPPPPGDGCGKEVDGWIKALSRPTKPAKPSKKPTKPVRPFYMTLAHLPSACAAVLEAE